jgi:hypothetical protein
MKTGTIGYLVIPSARTVQRVKCDDYRDIYVWVGCSAFDCARLENGDAFFVDDEGLLVQQQPDNFFAIDGRDPLAGNGLLLGCDSEGESVEPSIAWEDFKRQDIVQHAMIIAVQGLGHAVVLSPFTYLDDILERRHPETPAAPAIPKGWDSV